MFGFKYKIWGGGWGPQVGAGATASIHVGVHGIAKAAIPGMPHVVASELICAQLARSLRLPVPPSLIVEGPNGAPYHVSMNFSLAGQNLPPADGLAIVAHSHSLAAGVVLFDAWVCNSDRHNQNLAFDAVQGKLMLFDHSHALFASPDIDAWITSHQGQLNIGGHCLAPYITDPADFKLWNWRISQIPEFFIDGLVDDAASVGLPAAKVAECTAFLKARRTSLLGILKANPSTFPAIPANSWANI